MHRRLYKLPIHTPHTIITNNVLLHHHHITSTPKPPHQSPNRPSTLRPRLPRANSQQTLLLLPNLLSLGSINHLININDLSSNAKKNQWYIIGQLILCAIQTTVSAISTSLPSTPQKNKVKEKDTIAKTLAGNKLNNHTKEQFQINSDQINTIRTILYHDVKVGAATYELFLDVLLYTNHQSIGIQTSNIPPPGLSILGKERLQASNNTSNWNSSMIKLKELKCCILDCVAPCCRWSFFDSPTTDTTTTDRTIDKKNNKEEEKRRIYARARTIALLIIATGDIHLDVAERASLYLKTHLDSMRNATTANTTTNSSNQNPTAILGSIKKNKLQNNSTTSADIPTIFLGSPITLSCELLSFVIGDVMADHEWNQIEFNEHKRRRRRSLLRVNMEKIL